MHSFSHLSLAPVLALAAFAPAQQAFIPEYSHRMKVDSRWQDNTTAQPSVVFNQVVKVAGAPWIRLVFSKTNLPKGSFLRITSLQDQGQLRLDAASLRSYGGSSCYFNGDSVRLELVAAAGSAANRVLVVEALTGSLNAQVQPVQQTICGSVDDRKQSQDKRQGRLQVGCTGWLFDRDLFGTAGHCVSRSRSQFIEFNVPNSSSGGSIRRSHPNDQYPMITSTVAYLNAGTGADWCVGKLNKNANTGKLPGDAQGSWYQLGTPPNTTSGQNIRITGYGSTSPRNYLNLVQKTHVGPLASLTGTRLRYRTDTTGGNSGSPVIHENTGKVIGVHTHGGCTSSGGSNTGTSINRSDWKSAITKLTQVQGSAVSFGNGCRGGVGIPVLSASANPQINTKLVMICANLRSGSKGLFVFGGSKTQSGSTKLPLDLKIVGALGCWQLVSLDVIVPGAAVGASYALFQANIPNQASLIGLKLHSQYVSDDPNANLAGFATSNGLTISIGG